jgi:hypothetical protein
MTRNPSVVQQSDRKQPVIPEDTCPYIDTVQELLDKMIDQDDKEWRREQAVLAKALLEYIRASNLGLRQASKYWHGRAKR